MKKWIAALVLVALVLFAPGVTAALLDALAAVAVTAAANPTVLGFAVGVVAAPRIRRWAR